MKDARDLEQRYRELEGRTEVTLETRVRRGQLGLLIALLLSVLLAAVTAAVDLRRLQSAEGTARAWVEATVFGDCSRHLALSFRPRGAAPRPREELCGALGRRSLDARTRVPGTRVRTRLLSEAGHRASAEAVVTRPAGVTTARVSLRRVGGAWRVVRDDDACRVGCD